jgi:O-antigen/teichoic acid export membrane protein
LSEVEEPAGEAEVLVAEGAPSGGAEPADRPPVRHGLSFAAVSFFVSVLIGIGSSIWTSRLYGIRVIGEYALVSAPYLITTQISQVNEGTAFVRAAADLPARGLRVSALFRLILGFSAVLTVTVSTIVFVVATLLLRGPVGQPELVLPALVVMVGYVCLDNLSWNIDSVLSAFRAGHVLFWARTSQLLAFLVVAVAMAPFTRSVWGLVVATLVSFAIPLAVRLSVAHRYVRWRLPAGVVREHRHELPAMLRFGLVLVPAVLVGAITGQAGMWVVGATASVAVTGAYARALGLASKFQEAAYRIAEILMPGMVERYRRGDPDGAADLLDRAFRLTGVSLLTLAAVGGGAGTGVLRVFGPGFDQANVVLALLCLAFVLAVLNYLQQQGLLAVGRPGLITAQSVGTSVLTGAAMFPLAHLLGATGVAAAYVLAKVAVVVVADRLLGRELTGRRTLSGMGLLLSLAATWAVGYGVAWALVQVSAGMAMTAVAVAAGGLAALVVAEVLGVVPRDDRDRLLEMVRSRLPRSS